jgi:radical SAM protein with 4Fe4S-binding SPASM domain
MLDRIYIEISNICNVQCSFCPVVDRDKQILSSADFEHIIKQAAPLASQVCLHLMGEPLAHPQFREIVKLCEENKVAVQITTNGLLIKKYQDFLLGSKSIRQVNFSLQSFKDNFPDKPIEPYLGDILNFSQEAFLKSPEMYLNLRLWNLESAAEDNEDIFRFIETHLGVLINRRVDVGGIKSKKLINRLYLHFDSRFEWPSLDLPYRGTKGRCNALIGHIGIHADGTVVPCCLDKEAKIPLGNCLEEKLQDILNSPRALEMKRGFQTGVLIEKLCQHCSYIERFSK